MSKLYLSTITIFLLIDVLLCGVSVPIKHLPGVGSIGRRFGTDGVSPPYEFSGGSWAIGLSMGNSDGLLYVNLDTGSFDLFVAPESCTTCVPTPPVFYTPSSSAVNLDCNTYCNAYHPSNTCKGKLCQTTVTYGDESGVTATGVRDVVGIPGLEKAVYANFGSIVTAFKSPRNGGTFLSEGQTGLIGVAYSSYGDFSAADYQEGPFDSLAAANNLPNIFSLCIDYDTPWMSFGENYFGGNNTDFIWTKVNNKVHFDFQLSDILLNYDSKTADGGGTSVGLSSSALNAKVPFMDSGTTLLYLSQNVFVAFYNTLISGCGNVNLNGVCGLSFSQSIFNTQTKLSTEDVAKYPTVQFIVPCVSSPGGCRSLNVPPEAWLRSVGSGYYLSGIKNNTLTIFGDVFMQNYHVVFDKVNDYLGFGDPSTCNLSGVPTNRTRNAGGRLEPEFYNTISQTIFHY